MIRILFIGCAVDNNPSELSWKVPHIPGGTLAEESINLAKHDVRWIYYDLGAVRREDAPDIGEWLSGIVTYRRLQCFSEKQVQLLELTRVLLERYQ